MAASAAGKWPEIGHLSAGQFKRSKREGENEETLIKMKAEFEKCYKGRSFTSTTVVRRRTVDSSPENEEDSEEIKLADDEEKQWSRE